MYAVKAAGKDALRCFEATAGAGLAPAQPRLRARTSS